MFMCDFDAASRDRESFVHIHHNIRSVDPVYTVQTKANSSTLSSSM